MTQDQPQAHKALSRWQKFKLIFRQSHNSVMVRQHDGVHHYSKLEFFQSIFGGYREDLLLCSALSASSYLTSSEALRWHAVASARGYHQLQNQPKAEFKSGYAIATFHYEIWVNPAEKRASVVFRGTNKPADWWANLRFITRYVPYIHDHYDQVLELAPQIEDAIEKALQTKNPTINASGHSLGGGLAQQFAYCSEHTRQVIAFAPSPITGYYSAPKKLRERCAKGLYIARVFEHGEVLAFARLPIRQFLPLSIVNAKIEEFRCNFLHGNIVAEHSMQDFAKALHETLHTDGEAQDGSPQPPDKNQQDQAKVDEPPLREVSDGPEEDNK